MSWEKNGKSLYNTWKRKLFYEYSRKRRIFFIFHHFLMRKLQFLHSWAWKYRLKTTTKREWTLNFWQSLSFFNMNQSSNENIIQDENNANASKIIYHWISFRYKNRRRRREMSCELNSKCDGCMLMNFKVQHFLSFCPVASTSSSGFVEVRVSERECFIAGHIQHKRWRSESEKSFTETEKDVIDHQITDFLVTLYFTHAMPYTIQFSNSRVAYKQRENNIFYM